MKAQILVLSSSLLMGAVESGPNLETIRAAHSLPALGAAIALPGETKVFMVGRRKMGSEQAALDGDKFHLGSNTKAMTATLLASFIERGKLRWDSLVSELLPELAAEMHPGYRGLTVEMLSSHTAGFSDQAIFEQNEGALWIKLYEVGLDPSEGRRLTARAFLTQPPASVPGTAWDYSNAGYMVLGAILEKISGRSWETLMREELFATLGMESCGFGPQARADLDPPDQPWPHRFNETGEPEAIEPQDNPRALGPAGTVHCSLEDWAKFARLHVDGFNGVDTSLLRAQSFVKLHASIPGNSYTYGGWIRVDREWAQGPALMHGGSNTMNRSTLWIAPKIDRAYLSVTNIFESGLPEATDEVVGALIRYDQR
jgi:CubicO group peptidase (beta-lactamase class C family)